jgi:hypothetical protein
VLIRVEGFDLPGLTCGPGPDYPDGHHDIHVAVQGRKGHQDLLGLVPANVRSVTRELETTEVSPPPKFDVRGQQIQGSPGRRFVYITWGVLEKEKGFRMFRRATVWLDAVPEEVLGKAVEQGVLVGRLGLSDDKGWPLCAAVRPPRIEWSVGTR